MIHGMLRVLQETFLNDHLLCEKDKWESVLQWAHGQCSKGDSCCFSHDELACGNSGEYLRREGRSSSPAPHWKAKQTDGEGQKPSKGQAIKRKALQTRVKFHAPLNSAKTHHVSFGILPCVKTTSLRQDAILATSVISDLPAMTESPNNKRFGKKAPKKPCNPSACVSRCTRLRGSS